MKERTRYITDITTITKVDEGGRKLTEFAWISLPNPKLLCGMRNSIKVDSVLFFEKIKIYTDRLFNILNTELIVASTGNAIPSVLTTIIINYGNDMYRLNMGRCSEKDDAVLHASSNYSDFVIKPIKNRVQKAKKS
jgi:hypothetical protein